MTASNLDALLDDALLDEALRLLHAGNAAELYAQISADHDLTQALFRQALQDPS